MKLNRKINRIIYKRNYLLWGLICLFGSCDSFVEVDLPASQLSGDAIFTDASTASAALVDVYSKMRKTVLVTGNSNGISNLLGHYGDELTYYSSGTLAELDFNRNGLLATNTTVKATWNDTYNLIYAVNAIIEGVSSSTSISAVNKEKLLGEAYFVRAYLHFYLVNLFGEIPYVLSTNYQFNTTISKKSITDVYASITTDLQQAVTLMPEAYPTAERVRPNRSVAYALMARAMLYSEHWSEAVLYSDKVIGITTLYTWVTNLNQVFLKNSTGTLWQLMPPVAGVNTLDAQTFIFSSGPPPNEALNSSLISSFEAGDLRRSSWVGTVTAGGLSWYYPFKYKLNNATATSAEYSILFRLEEQYLIRAEAYAQLGNLEKSKLDLNKVRNRAGLSNTAALTKEELLTAILKERRVELFTELGHRWFDLKRTGLSHAVLSLVKPGWQATDVLWPLPETELLLNPNILPQNPGY
jgi:hypothetical protein